VDRRGYPRTGVYAVQSARVARYGVGGNAVASSRRWGKGWGSGTRSSHIEPARITDLAASGGRTRRQFMVSAGGLAMVLACGDQPVAGSGSRLVEDAFGSVELPPCPRRVVAVRHHHIGNTLALDVTPIGIVPNASEFPFPGHAEALAGVANVRAEADWMLDVEKALALEPDLILEMSGQEGESWNQEICDLAKAAATTACFPYGYTYEDEIKQNMLDVGVVLGIEEQAAEVIAAFDARVSELKPKIAKAGITDRPVATIIWQGSGNFFVPVDRPSNMILRGLDIPQPGFQADPAGGEVAFSFERANLLNDAYAVIVLLEGAGTREELEANPIWQLTSPAQNGRVIFLDSNLWSWDYLPALMHMLDDVEGKLLPLTT
jgi:ABC-type Fe3+-hydroxamate transport system substrate-binding protein